MCSHKKIRRVRGATRARTSLWKNRSDVIESTYTKRRKDREDTESGHRRGGEGNIHKTLSTRYTPHCKKTLEMPKGTSGN